MVRGTGVWPRTRGGVMVALGARATPFGDEGRGHIHDTCDTHGLYASPPSDPFAARCVRVLRLCVAARESSFLR